MKKDLQDLLLIFSLFGIAFLICMESTANIFSSNLTSNIDSNVFRYIGWSMTQGYIPYLELFDHKGLLLYFINYIGALISPIQGVWFIEILFMFISVIFAYKLARKFTTKPVSLLIVAVVFSLMDAFFEGGNYTEEYALPFQLIALNIFFDFFLNTKKYLNNEISKEKKSMFKLEFKWFNIPVFICGICFAAVIFLRANMISVWIVFCLMVLVYCIKNKNYKGLIKFTISFVCGILILTAPMIIYLYINGALESFIEQYILFNMKYSNDMEMTRIEVLSAFINNPVTLIAFIAIIAKLYKEYKNKENFYFDLGYFAYMIITLVLIAMGGRCYGHYGMTSIPMLIYPYCILYDFLEKRKKNNPDVKLIVTVYLLVTIVFPIGLKSIGDCAKKISGKKGYIVNSEVAEVLDYINENTEENDLISAFGNREYIYLATKRQSASKYSYQLPVALSDEKIIDEYINDLENNKAKLIILTEEIDNQRIRQKMKEFLNKKYVLVLDRNMKIYKMEE